jgi:micrococcal nuclease
MLGRLQAAGRARFGALLTAALLALPFFAPSLPAQAGPVLQGKVVRVSDGDTLVVQVDPNRQEKVRLLGIDTPEMAQQPWGERAKAFTERLALGKLVRLEADVQPRDQYGRLLAYAYVGKTFVNYELVRQGYAMLLTYPPNVAHVDDFTRAQALARKEGKGIWRSKDGLDQSPRDFRRQKRGDSRSRADAPPSAPTRDAAPAQAPPAGAIVANAKSRIFHDASCPLGAKIGAANRLVLPSASDAKAKGYSACKRCGG